MALFPTNLFIVSSVIPPDFIGTPLDFQKALVERLQIFSAAGTQFFTVSDNEPLVNVGPWLKGGTQWWVFDETLGRYVPLDISPSLQALFIVSEAEPAAPLAGEASIWLRVSGGRVIDWFFWTGTAWVPGVLVPPSGPTSARPANPVDLEQFFDTDINVMLHFSRGAWRTLSGSPGDIKFVTTALLADALTDNPGWVYLGQNEQGFRGKSLVVATKDGGASPAISFTTEAGVSERAPGDTFGVETVTLADDEISQHSHLVGAMTLFSSNDNAFFYRVDNTNQFTAPAPAPPNHALVSGAGGNGTLNGELPATSDGTMLITSKQLSESTAAFFTAPAQPHDNVQPSVAFWALTKL